MIPAEPNVLTAAAYGGTGLPRYSIGTLVTNLEHYAAMRATFAAGGFDGSNSEFLYLDNRGPHQSGAYRGLNALMSAARGRYVILCHQDVRLITDGLDTLDRCLAELDTRDLNWALAGNAGGLEAGVLAHRISDPHGADRNSGNLPARVMSLDENFIVVKRRARVGCSADLEGFHFYGPDLCLNADIAGYSAWVIDFHLLHLSGGTKSNDFYVAQEAFRAKWSHALRPRWMQTTCALLRLSGFGLDRGGGASRGAAICRAAAAAAATARCPQGLIQMSDGQTAQRTLGRRVAGQGALLMSGFAASQILSFGRNAMLGHMLAKGDFGIAAILTLLLQLLDNLTDLGVDRLIVQAPDGARPRFIATNHTALMIRGIVVAVLCSSDPFPSRHSSRCRRQHRRSRSFRSCRSSKAFSISTPGAPSVVSTTGHSCGSKYCRRRSR